MKEHKISELLTKAELRKVEKYLVENKPQKLREYLNEDKRKAKLLKKKVDADYLYYWLITSTMENIKKKNEKFEKKEQKKKEEYERHSKQDTGKSKPEEKGS